MFRIYVSIYIQVNKGCATNEERSDTNDKLDCFFKCKCSDLAAPRAARDQLVYNIKVLPKKYVDMCQSKRGEKQ